MKDKGLLAIFGPKPKDKGESDDTTEDEAEGTDYDDAAADVADILGVPEEKRKALGLALRRLVMACHEEE